MQRILARSEALCRERGVRLTDQRRRVLEILCGAGRSVGAYEILEAMRDGPRALGPPTVYRALEFLVDQGLAHKLESQHAYVGCDRPGLPHAGQFLICNQCGLVTEMDDAGLVRRLTGLARGTGFRPARPVVELIGTCAACARLEAP